MSSPSHLRRMWASTARLLCSLALISLTTTGCARGTSDPSSDADLDAESEFDAGTDADLDAGTDADLDAGTDADLDAGTDADLDAATDADLDAATDADTGPVDCLALFDGLPAELDRLTSIGPDVRGPFPAAASPRAFDVDRDGCADLVFGSGLEFDSGRVVAVSGTTGELLWITTVRGDVFGSAVFRLLPSGVVQVVAGGRDGTLVALDGATGAELWATDASVFGEREVHFNFYTPQWIEDVNADGYGDLLVVHGGDVYAGPGDPRDPSWIAIVDGMNGNVLARRVTPDLAESYTSPVILRDALESPSTGTVFVFGTGGETLPGSLFLGTVAELLEPSMDGNWGTPLTPGTSGKGIIAPTVIADLDGDGELDLAVVDFGGRVSLLTGPTFTEAWHVDFTGEEAYATAAPVRLTGGSFALAVSHNTGAFPLYSKTTHRLLRASDGELLESFESTLPFSPSPLSVDLDGDGADEWLMASTTIFGESLQAELAIFDVARQSLEPFELPFAMFATPLVHVAEGHEQLELVLVGFQVNELTPLSPPDFLFRRVALGATRPAAITWGAYMGNCGTGQLLCGAD